MYNLFLDDERNPADVTWVAIYNHAPFEVVRSFDEFVNFITQFGIPDFVTFDHDLADTHYKAMANVEVEPGQKCKIWMPDEEGGLNMSVDYGTEKTGYDCAKWLVDFCIDTGTKFPKYMVHSMNPIGKKRINDYIEWAKEKTNI